jgi:hypothetical protein
VEAHNPHDHRADSVAAEDIPGRADMADSLGDRKKECSAGGGLLAEVDSHDFPLSPQWKEAADVVASALAQQNDLSSL